MAGSRGEYGGTSRSPRTRRSSLSFLFFFNDTPTTEIYTLSLHDALPICHCPTDLIVTSTAGSPMVWCARARSEEHTSELQSPCNIVCRLMLEKKRGKLLAKAERNHYFDLEHTCCTRHVE